MYYTIITDTLHANYPITLLVPAIRKDEIKKEYLDPFGIPHDDVMVISLHYNQTKKKTPAKEMKQYVEEELIPALEDINTKYIIVTDGDYFKILTKTQKVDANLGYVLDCAFGPWKVVYVPFHKAIFFDPKKIRDKIKQGMNALLSHINGNYTDPGKGIIHFSEYPRTESEIARWLELLLELNKPLAIDIEAFDLKHYKAGIATITFCWNKHEGIAFPVDYVEIDGATSAPYGMQIRNEPVRKLLRSFFERYTQTAIYHNISFDVYVLIYQLYMSDLIDTAGLLNGMNVLLRNWEDTKLISYLTTNSCAGNKLSLKDQAQDYSGNYAQTDIEDITKIPLSELLEYNLIDGLSTWFVYEKHWDTLVNDQQEDIYRTLFQPATLDIIQMQLTGMPLNAARVKEVKAILESDEAKALDTIHSSPLVQRFTYTLNEEWVAWKNSTLKKKQVTLADAKEVFNPNSNPQLQGLLYNMLALPVLAYTDSKLPSTDRDTLTALLAHTSDPEIKALLNALLDYSAVVKITSSVIPALMKAPVASDGWSYLYGNFNLGGTVSGRLSSSKINLQNLPSTGSKYAKVIKSCFQAPPGWIFAGLDFASLEDKISALTTKDPNKLLVYLQGYDGHCLRAYYYYREEMPDIVDTVDSINSIAKKYKNLRQESKAPSFALTYQGTYMTLMTNCGFSMEKAKLIEARYHELYSVSDAWVQDKITKAAKDGYITGAFGLRIRTPLLKQVIRGTSKTPYEAEAEARTAGNALGQSWCLLNNRAGVEFMGKVRTSSHRLDIRPCAHIHDAQYMMVRDDIATVMYVNKHLVEAVNWQDHPDIYHESVRLGGEFSLFWPNWAHEIVLPNGATEEEIVTIINDSVIKTKP